MSVDPSHPTSPAKNAEGDFDQFTDFMRKLVAVPHETIKNRIAEDKAEKRAAKGSASHAPASS